MVRRSDGISTFSFSLSNPRRKYDSVFTPNDRIVVMMKRLAWVRVFTGLLNSVPLITAWPMVVPLTASCSLKRLQYWFWDANASNTQNMIRDALSATQESTGNGDAGVTNVVLTILKNVAGWPPEKVHIGRIPPDWFDIALEIAKDVDELAEESDAMAAEFKAILDAQGIVAGASTADGGPATGLNGTLSDGTYGGVELKGKQLRIAETIYSVCIGMGGSDTDAVIGMITANVESTFHNYDHGHSSSLGVFQQINVGWGTAKQRMDVTYAATSFFKHLFRVKNRGSMTPGQAAQAVQISGFPDKYQLWVKMGEALVARLKEGNPNVTGGVGGAKATDNNSSATTPTGTTTPGVEGTSTASAFARQASDFVTAFPNIPFGVGSYTDAYLSVDPPANQVLHTTPLPGIARLDNSAFVLAIFLRTVGGSYGMHANINQIASWCKSSGAKKLTGQQGIDCTGALLFFGPEGKSTHIEISLGDGRRAAGVRNDGKGAAVRDLRDMDQTKKISFGYQVPRIGYNGQPPVTTGGAASPSTDPTATATDPADALADPTYAKDLASYNPNDPFDNLFGDNFWPPSTPASNTDMYLAESLVGIRALMNDQPLLPYLMNLFNSQMRSFCSAPNGDLIAWFPDYYGLWGTAAKMVVEPIEVQDFTVMWADDYFITHQFVSGGTLNKLSIPDGNVSTSFLSPMGAMTSTTGIATIDIAGLMYALFGVRPSQAESEAFTKYIYKQFGARPTYDQMPGLVGPKAAFFGAIFMFLRQWAYQYNADVPLTFMPELWPGMIIQIPAFDFQAYVTTVTHTFQMGKGGQFSTSVNIAAPARMPKAAGDKDHVLVGLPLAGKFRPGHGEGNINTSGNDFS